MARGVLQHRRCPKSALSGQKAIRVEAQVESLHLVDAVLSAGQVLWRRSRRPGSASSRICLVSLGIIQVGVRGKSPTHAFQRKKLKLRLLKAVVNHEDQIKQLAKTCTQIADLLPRAEITLELYQTDAVHKAVTSLYISIIEFLRHAVKWYKQGKLRHTWTAITRPWDLGFRDYVEDIDLGSRRLEQLASISSHAELRDTHLETSRIREELRETRVQLDKLLQITYREYPLVSTIALCFSARTSQGF